MNESRADSFLQMIHRSARGRLKVYLGYGPGVGKTYQMLQEGYRLREQHIDVVVGLVETHGRAETAALCDGLEILPRQRVEYHGVLLEEMDVPAVLARKPQVALIDELAHTNVPGSRNAKRYQDVQDILAEGIHVITTLNVQHLESLYDIVERLIGVKVKERLPDAVLAEADEVVNIDLATEDLRKRLESGKIYPKERIETALNHFFRSNHLEQLRELTFREIAAHIDQKHRISQQSERVTAPDQILVCLDTNLQASKALLRYGSRLAGRLNRNWYALHVQTPSEEPTAIDATTQRLLSQTLILANQLGAKVFTFKGQDIAGTILQFAREYGIGHIVLGRPQRPPWWKRLFHIRSPVSRLIEQVRGVSLVIIETDPEVSLDKTDREIVE